MTGGAGGIGAGLCRAPAGAGATVVVVDVDSEGAERVGEALRAAGGSADRPAAVLVEHMPAFLARRGLDFVRAQAAAAGVAIVSRVS